jgi:putative endonuclease
MNTRDKGKLGEQIALKYLLKNNYHLVTKNFYTRFGEIDIIALDKKLNELVFIEVKARNSDYYGYPEDAIDYYKFNKLTKTAQLYLARYNINSAYRFDCLSLELNPIKRLARVRHFINIGL